MPHPVSQRRQVPQTSSRDRHPTKVPIANLWPDHIANMMESRVAPMFCNDYDQ